KRKARTPTRGTTVETSSVSEFLVVSCLPVCLGALSCVLSACLHIGLEVWIFSCV
ncbi:unnamed protein product, partial [Brassica rapa subsp. trilocularis]